MRLLETSWTLVPILGQASAMFGGNPGVAWTPVPALSIIGAPSLPPSQPETAAQTTANSVPSIEPEGELDLGYSQNIPWPLQQFIAQLANSPGSPNYANNILPRQQPAGGAGAAGAGAGGAGEAPAAGAGGAGAPAAGAGGAGGAGAPAGGAPAAGAGAPGAQGGVGGGAGPPPDQPTQVPSVTEYTISGTAIVYTQKFVPTPDPWEKPKPGTIGLGTLTGSVGAVKTPKSDADALRARGLGAAAAGAGVGGYLML